MRPAGKVAGDLGEPQALRAMADRLAQNLRVGAARGVRMIGLAPAFVMALRQDYPKAGVIVPEGLMPHEFLAQRLDRGVQFPQAIGGAIMVFTHCTESTGAVAVIEDWHTVLAALGIDAKLPATGCCGIAGMFGHKTRQQGISRKVFNLSWATPLKQADQAAATGFSCRCQSERLTGLALRHSLGLIADRLEARAD